MNIKKIGVKIGATLIIPCAVYLLFFILRPDAFGKVSLIWTLFNQSIAFIIMAWGMSFEMTANNMDMSVGAEMILDTLVGCLFAQKLGIPGMILGVVIVATVVGTIKSVLMAVINMKAIIISIAYTLILGSFGYMLVAGQSVILPSEYTSLGKFPASLIILIIVGIFMYYLQRYSIFGAQCRALGGNEALAISSGINKTAVETKSIFICSFYAAIAAVIYLSRGAGSAGATGLSSMATVFSAMTGVFVAFILTKYIDITIGIIVGVISMNIITIGLIALNMPSSMKDSVNGGFLLLLMIIDFITEKREAEKLRRAAFSAKAGQAA